MEHIYLEHLIDNNISFAIYRLPNDDKLTLILQDSEHLTTFDDISKLELQEGFVISPFNVCKTSPIVLIKPEHMVEGKDKIAAFIESYKINHNEQKNQQITDFDEGINTFEAYNEKFDSFLNEIKEEKFSKLVFSRTKDILLNENFSCSKLFQKACEAYPENYVYLSYTPLTNIWIGASPEIILQHKDNQWSTVALAGTREFENESEYVQWDAKNQLEQYIVIEYMQNQLNSIGIESNAESIETVKSGNVAHLKSIFKFQLKDNSHIGKLLKHLHPTPAVCGFPKEEAFQFILTHENYNRSYYSGFIGFISPNKPFNLFVNLRCMEIRGNKARLYAGGGLLENSNVESEWLETEAKIQTMSSLL